MAEKLELVISGNTVQLDKSLRNINQGIRVSREEARKLSKELELDPTNLDKAVERHEQLGQAVELANLKVQDLKDQMSKIDTSVDPRKFTSLRASFLQAEKQAKELTDELNKSSQEITRIKYGAATFKFKTPTGVIEFANTIEGVTNALATLGDMRDIIKIDKSGSAQDLKKQLRNINDALFASERLVELMQKKLKTLNPNTQEFLKLQKQLNQVKSNIDNLTKSKVELKASVSVPDGHNIERVQNKIYNIADATKGLIEKLKSIDKISLSDVGKGLLSGITTGAKGLGKGVVAAHTKPLQAAANATKNLLGGSLSGFAKKFGSMGVNAAVNLGRGMISGLSKTASLAVSATNKVFSAVGSVAKSAITKSLSGVGGAIKSAVTAPLKGLNAIVGNIVKGALLTVGQNITNGIGQATSGAIASMEDTQKSAKSLENVLSFSGVDTGTIEHLKSSMADYTNTTKFASGEVNKVVSGLVASGVEASKTERLTKGIGNAYALLGDGSRSLSDIGTIFAQINSATKLTAEDFNQLRDAGIGGALKNEITKSFPEIIAQFGSFQEAMSKGAISADMVNQAIQNIGESDAATKAASVPKTMGEAFSTLQKTLGTKFQETYNRISDNGIKSLSKVTNTISNMDLSKLSEGLSKVADSAFGLIDKVLESMQGVDFSKVFDGVSVVLKPIGDRVSAMIGLIKDVSSSVDISKVFEVASKAAGALNSVTETVFKTLGDILKNIDFSKVFNGATRVLDGIGATIKGLGTAFTKAFDASTVTTIISNVGKTIETIVSTMSKLAQSDGMTSFVKGFAGAIEGVSGIILSITQAVSKAFDSIGKTDLASKLGSSLSNIGRDIAAIFNSEGFSAFVSGALGSVITAFTTIGDIVGTVTHSIVKLFAGTNTKGISKAFDGINETIKGVGEVVKGVVELIASLFSSDVVQGGLESFKGSFDSFMSSLTGALQSEGLKNALAGLLSGVTKLGGAVIETFKAITDAISSPMMEGTLIEMGAVFDDFGAKVSEFFASDFTQSLVLVVIKVVADIFNEIAKLVNIVIDAFNVLAAIDLTPLLSMWNYVFSPIKGFIDGLLEPIKELFANLKDSKALEPLNGVLREIGRTFDFMAGVMKPVAEFLGKIAGTAIRVSIEALFNVLNPLLDLVKWLLARVNDGWSWAADLLNSVVGDSKSAKRGAAEHGYVSNSSIAYAATYATTSHTNNVTVNVSGNASQPATELARQIKNEIILGLA